MVSICDGKVYEYTLPVVVEIIECPSADRWVKAQRRREAHALHHQMQQWVKGYAK